MRGAGCFRQTSNLGSGLMILVSNNLRLTENDKMERAAAMWAAVWRCAGAVWRCRNLRQSVLASGCSGLASGGVLPSVTGCYFCSGNT